MFVSVCSAPLGMENGNDGQLTHDQVKTSTVSTSSRDNPRLRHGDPFTGSNVWTPFIQVDLGPASKRLTAIAVQGHSYDYNTWTFYMKYMEEGTEWCNYTENGVTRVSETSQQLLLRTELERCHDSKLL